jgi:NAD(P)-dependent dehydrogenase (short-subunit alcohol dehydrogenase family)
MSELASRIAVVTGAGRGIGRAVAKSLAAQGALVVAMARTREDLNSLAAEAGALVVPFAGDVTREADVAAAFAAGGERGPVTIVVAAAGTAAFGSTSEFTMQQWHAVLSVNLAGVFLTCREALRVMQEGNVVTIGSVAGHTAFPNSAAYCASKWGVAGLTRALAAEVRASGRTSLHFTLLAPGSVDTSLWETQGWSPPRDEMLLPEDVARSVLHIVTTSPRASVDEIRLMPARGIL